MRLPAVLGSRAALVVAHPGHELRVHGWLELARPTVFVLTDGSGRSGRSRLGSTTQVLARLGAEPGSIYGVLTDLMLYSAVLKGDFDFFVGLAEGLANALVRNRIQYVVGDAAEGTIMAHDVCRLVVNAAVEIANRSMDLPVANFDFSVMSRPDECPEALRGSSICLHLDDEAFARKWEAARNYAEVADEAKATLEQFGIEAFRVEWFRPVAG
ncbi:MAG TPA: hypothetical protein VFF86_02680, partial [Candidatus Methylomirabilis sp.]|nr:hypothetical protein [Candidatus Methylomirabilis sp.]